MKNARKFAMEVFLQAFKLQYKQEIPHHLFLSKSDNALYQSNNISSFLWKIALSLWKITKFVQIAQNLLDTKCFKLSIVQKGNVQVSNPNASIHNYEEFLCDQSSALK